MATAVEKQVHCQAHATNMTTHRAAADLRRKRAHGPERGLPSAFLEVGPTAALRRGVETGLLSVMGCTIPSVGNLGPTEIILILILIGGFFVALLVVLLLILKALRRR